MRVKVRSKVIPASFLKVEGRETLVGAKTVERGTDKKNWSPDLKAPLMSKKEPERMEQRRCQGKATARGEMEKGRYATVIKGEEVRRNDPIE